MTHFDIILCNTFITCSAFIIILVTMDRWRCICSPTTPADTNPGLYCVIALGISFLWQVPRIFMKTTTTECKMVEFNSSNLEYGALCDCEEGSGPSLEPGAEECREQVSVVDKSHLVKQFPWVLYVILAELFTR